MLQPSRLKIKPSRPINLVINNNLAKWNGAKPSKFLLLLKFDYKSLHLSMLNEHVDIIGEKLIIATQYRTRKV